MNSIKVKDNELLILDQSVYVENGEMGAFTKFLNSHTARAKKKPVYRIVSNQIEPFVIVSQLDEELQNQADCNDGLPCLQIQTNDDMAFSGSFVSLHNKELMIDLIKSYKKRTHDEMKRMTIENMKLRTKCCTG